MLFNKINQLRKENQYNQAILTLLEACCDGLYQDYILRIGGGLNKVDAFTVSETIHLVLATSGTTLFIVAVDTTGMTEERRLEFPSKLTSLATVAGKDNTRLAFVGSESGEVWQVHITRTGDTIHALETTAAKKTDNKIISLNIHRDFLAYSPLRDPSIHLYHLSKKDITFLKKNNYENVAQVQFFRHHQSEYCALGFTDREKEVPFLALYNEQEDFIWGAEEVEGSVRTLKVIHEKDGGIIILAGTEKSMLYAVDLEGKVRWKFKMDSVVNCMEVSYRPETKEPYTFVGLDGGTLYLLDSLGTVKWKKVFHAAVKDLALVNLAEPHYPHVVVGLSDNTIHSLCRSPAEDLAPLFSELFSEILNKTHCSEASMIEQFTTSDYQLIREFGEVRSFGFDNAAALLILQFTHLARPLEEIIGLLMPRTPSARSLARLAEFRLNYEKRKSTYDLNLRNRFENLYQRGDLQDAFATGCQLVYQSYDLQWSIQLPHPVDHLLVIDRNRFLTASEKSVTLVDRLIPSKDIQITLPSKIVACLTAWKKESTDTPATFTIFTKDYKMRYFKLPLIEVETVDVQGDGERRGEVREKSVTMLDGFFSFSTSDKRCSLYALSSKKAVLIKCFKTDFQTTAAILYADKGERRIALGTRSGKILVYSTSAGDVFSAHPEEPVWSADIEGMVECITAAVNTRGETLLIAGSSSGAVKAFDFAGTLLWEFRTITERLHPGRGIRLITTVGGQHNSPLYLFLLAGERIYVMSEDGRLRKVFTFPEIILRIDPLDPGKEGQASFVLLFAHYRLTAITFYLSHPLSRELEYLYQTLAAPCGEEKFFMDLMESEQPHLRAFALQRAPRLTARSLPLKDLVISSMKTLYQQDPVLRQVTVKSLESTLTAQWDTSLLLDNIDFNDLYQFSGVISLLEKVGKSTLTNRENVTQFLKTLYATTKREACHIAILQLLEELLKDDPHTLAQILFDITPFESAHWVSQEIGIILGRILGTAYLENFNLLTRCFYVSSVSELKALSREIRDTLPLYEKKLSDNGMRALTIFTTINWDEKESMDEPFTAELEQLERLLNRQSQNIATALFNKWERILKKVRSEEVTLNDLSVMAWHRVESLNSHVRHSIVEGCFSGLESFALMLKDTYGDQDIVNSIAQSISQLSIVRQTLTDYFEEHINREIRLKDIFFLEYKSIFKELAEIEKLSADFGNNVNDLAYREAFSQVIPEKTRSIQRKNLAAIDLAVKRLKTDVRTILENLFEDRILIQALHQALISVDRGLPALDSSQFKVLAREHELFNAFYEIINNILHHAYRGIEDGRERTVRVSAECYADENLYLKITIADNGIGMTPEELSRIRDISFTKGGTGEGIERVFQLIGRNLGKVHYQSEKGKGTAVSISLPLKIRKEF